MRTAGVGISEADLREDVRYLVRTWLDIRAAAEKVESRPRWSIKISIWCNAFCAISCPKTSPRSASTRKRNTQRIVEFINRIQPRMVKRVKLYTRDQPILEAYGVQAEIDKAIKPRVWLKSGGYLVINQTEALVAIDVNTGKFVGRGSGRLEDTITRTNLEAVDEIVRQIRLRDLGGIIVLDLIDMEERRNRTRVMQALQDALRGDKSPTKVLSFNDFGLVIMTRKRVKQSLERTLCAPCQYCQGAGLIKSPQTICYELLEEARTLGKAMNGDKARTSKRRCASILKSREALRSTERDVLNEIEEYLGPVDINSDPASTRNSSISRSSRSNVSGFEIQVSEYRLFSIVGLPQLIQDRVLRTRNLNSTLETLASWANWEISGKRCSPAARVWRLWLRSTPRFSAMPASRTTARSAARPISFAGNMAESSTKRLGRAKPWPAAGFHSRHRRGFVELHVAKKLRRAGAETSGSTPSICWASDFLTNPPPLPIPPISTLN